MVGMRLGRFKKKKKQSLRPVWKTWRMEVGVRLETGIEVGPSMTLMSVSRILFFILRALRNHCEFFTQMMCACIKLASFAFACNMFKVGQ